MILNFSPEIVKYAGQAGAAIRTHAMVAFDAGETGEPSPAFAFRCRRGRRIALRARLAPPLPG
jgi:hypothetical protein